MTNIVDIISSENHDIDCKMDSKSLENDLRTILGENKKENYPNKFELYSGQKEKKQEVCFDKKNIKEVIVKNREEKGQPKNSKESQLIKLDNSPKSVPENEIEQCSLISSKGLISDKDHEPVKVKEIVSRKNHKSESKDEEEGDNVNSKNDSCELLSQNKVITSIEKIKQNNFCNTEESLASINERGNNIIESETEDKKISKSISIINEEIDDQLVAKADLTGSATNNDKVKTPLLNRSQNAIPTSKSRKDEKVDLSKDIIKERSQLEKVPIKREDDSGKVEMNKEADVVFVSDDYGLHLNDRESVKSQKNEEFKSTKLESQINREVEKTISIKELGVKTNYIDTRSNQQNQSRNFTKAVPSKNGINTTSQYLKEAENVTNLKGTEFEENPNDVKIMKNESPRNHGIINAYKQIANETKISDQPLIQVMEKTDLLLNQQTKTQQDNSVSNVRNQSLDDAADRKDFKEKEQKMQGDDRKEETKESQSFKTGINGQVNVSSKSTNIFKVIESFNMSGSVELAPVIMKQIEKMRESGKSWTRVSLGQIGGEDVSIHLKMDAEKISVRFSGGSEVLMGDVLESWNSLKERVGSNGFILQEPEFIKS